MMPFPSASLEGSSFCAMGRIAVISSWIWSSESVGRDESSDMMSASVALPDSDESTAEDTSTPVTFWMAAMNSGFPPRLPRAWKSIKHTAPAPMMDETHS